MSITSAPASRNSRRRVGSPREPFGRVVDLGDDPDVPGAVVGCPRRSAEIPGISRRSLGPRTMPRRAGLVAITGAMSPSQSPGSSPGPRHAGISRNRAIHGVVMSAATVILSGATGRRTAATWPASVACSADSASLPVTKVVQLRTWRVRLCHAWRDRHVLVSVDRRSARTSWELPSSAAAGAGRQRTIPRSGARGRDPCR